MLFKCTNKAKNHKPKLYGMVDQTPVQMNEEARKLEAMCSGPHRCYTILYSECAS